MSVTILHESVGSAQCWYEIEYQYFGSRKLKLFQLSRESKILSGMQALTTAHLQLEVVIPYSAMARGETRFDLIDAFSMA